MDESLAIRRNFFCIPVNNVLYEIQNEPWSDNPVKAMPLLRTTDPQNKRAAYSFNKDNPSSKQLGSRGVSLDMEDADDSEFERY